MSDIDLEFLKSWEGKQEVLEDDITLFPARALAAALDHDVLPEKGDNLPTFWEWLYFLPTPRGAMTGADGHPAKGGFLPPVPLPRRMWAAGEAKIRKPLIIGESAKRTSTILSVDLKHGSSGTLVFVNVQHDIHQNGELCITQVQNIVYREQPTEKAALPPGKSPEDDALWSEDRTIDPVLLFRFSALTYNGHRIHYDRPYAENEELYPALVVHGPLLVTLLLNLKAQQEPNKTIKEFYFRAVRPTFDINPLKLQGSIDGHTLKLWSTDQDNMVCMKLDAVVE